MNRWLLSMSAAVIAALPCAAQEVLTDDSLDAVIDYLRPDDAETGWCDVHWRQSFREGVKDSQIDGKPILLWAMNGHPMGCV